MKKYALSLTTIALILGVALPAQALLCPQLVKDCQTLIAKVEGKGGDASEAKEHCQRAQQLHEQGKHADAVIQAGTGIKEAGEAAK